MMWCNNGIRLCNGGSCDSCGVCRTNNTTISSLFLVGVVVTSIIHQYNTLYDAIQVKIQKKKVKCNHIT